MVLLIRRPTKKIVEDRLKALNGSAMRALQTQICNVNKKISNEKATQHVIRLSGHFAIRLHPGYHEYKMQGINQAHISENTLKGRYQQLNREDLLKIAIKTQMALDESQPNVQEMGNFAQAVMDKSDKSDK